jgi:multicomponent Na+:H+ antiporter subunit D
MAEHFPALIVVIPLLAALLIAAVGWFNRKACFPIAVVALFSVLLMCTGLLSRVMESGRIEYHLGGWAPPWGIAYQIDFLNGIVLVVVALVAFLNLLASWSSVEQEMADKAGAFYCLYVLFTTGLLGMVVTGDAFNLYVLLEISSLTAYALLGMGDGRSALSGLNYVFMGTIGASFYLLGVGYIYLVTGSLNMADIAARLPALHSDGTVLLAFILCMTGLFVKMALFPLHMWLPNAYANAPSVSASLIAPLTTKVMIYVMIRIGLNLFSPSFTFELSGLAPAMVWLAVIAIVAGSVMALFQRRLKRMLAYIVVAEVGYMVGGFWLGNRAAVAGAILHIVNDAMMTLCVFLAAGLIVHRVRTDAFSDLKGLFRKMPFTMAAFVVGGLSIIGVPPMCGFFSKWYLLSGGIVAGHYGFVAALLFSSLINVALFFRIIEIGYFEPLPGSHGYHHEPPAKMTEAPVGMLVPLWATAGLLLALGVYSGDIVTRIMQFIPEAVF